jgi:3-oxoacyl-(acyl-carrier-protein) synthase/acyl carrier protein
MKKTIFLFSGEGTSNRENTTTLISSSAEWTRSKSILESSFGLNLDELWADHIGSNQGPYSPLLTAITEICLSDLWTLWGYRPDAVIGHSTGELAAAYRAGLYSLESVLSLALKIGKTTSHLEGIMMHGYVDEKDALDFPVYISSRNFKGKDGLHVTVSGSKEDMEAFARTQPDFKLMKPGHPWHHPDYNTFAETLENVPCENDATLDFVSGISSGFETRLPDDYWATWLTHPVDFIAAMETLRTTYPNDDVTFIEIGFHPVLDQACTAFETYTHVSSLFRGEEDIPWIINQRRKLDPAVFTASLNQALEGFRPQIDYDTSLAYQGLTSIKYVELSGLLQTHFPTLAPQDFYRFKTINELVNRFGVQRLAASHAGGVAAQNRVVVCGMSCRLPGSAEHPAQFWDALTRKEDPVRSLSERGNAVAGFLQGDNARFDHSYFGIPPAEAKTMDPQQILALELTELVFKDAEIDPSMLDRKRIGVYVGVWNQEYGGDTSSAFYPTGTNPSIIASRISYQYDLRGPSWVVNTACSSSLVAIHYAAKDIEAGRVDYAIAGGVNMLLGDRFSDSMRKSGFLSPDNRCKTFDNSANGYVRAEGGGLVLLANPNLVDRYYAELIGSAVNQNGGRSQVITAPHPEAQEELILDACEDARIDPNDMAYVECHGTGTKIGDPIEITAIQNTLARNRTTPLYLGSVKSNIGHLESAAGIAGIIKSVLALNHGRIPANLHFETPNQFIDFEARNLMVVSQETPISRQAILGISSFGFGGANAHIVIRGAEDPVRKEVILSASPFDKKRATGVQDFIEGRGTRPEARKAPIQTGVSDSTIGRDRVAETIKRLFVELSGFDDIDPALEMTDQGLSSLSFTEMISQLEVLYDITIEPDVMFDYPYFDPFVDHIASLVGGNSVEDAGASDDTITRNQVADTIKRLFVELSGFDDIDPALEMTDQGLNSLSFTEMISQLEVLYDITIEPDVMFDYPLYDQLVDHIFTLTTV